VLRNARERCCRRPSRPRLPPCSAAMPTSSPGLCELFPGHFLGG
jgi:hypothetical protein